MELNVPDTRTLPLASELPLSAPETELPETVNESSPLSLVNSVPSGKASVEASE